MTNILYSFFTITFKDLIVKKLIGNKSCFLLDNCKYDCVINLCNKTEKMQITNRKAHFNFEIEEEIEAGIILLGSEVKSLREGKASISEAYIAENKGEILLINANINEYKGANKFNHTPKRPRKLLLHKKEIDKVMGKINLKGYSATPIRIYFNKRNIAKVLIGLGRGKKVYDKRETIKERDEKRRSQRGED